MPKTVDLAQTIQAIAGKRGVFRPEAYLFVLESLEMAMENIEVSGHVSGTDLLNWIRRLGQERYGVMAGDVFNCWGVQGTLDFGRIVFHLVEEGLLKKRDEDSLIDFLDRFDFQDAFTLQAFRGRG
ncbi:MAG: Minf_1886 family protein [Candidatus Krumholzibacteriia bacterium]